MKRYPIFKDSGVEWLGEVPEHWNVGSIRWLTRRYSGGTPDKANHAYWEDGTIPWLNSGAVNDRLITEPSTFITDEALANSSAKWIPKGALVMALAGQGKTKGMVAQLAIPSTCNQSMAAIIPGTAFDARFLFWWLESNYENIRNMAGGDLRDGLNLELLGNIQCPLPLRPEQTQIASFLDSETAKIDVLVTEQGRLIELLKEKRQAVIAHAVTRGLNPDAPIKPSGTEWLGDVPAHWDITKVKHLAASIEQGWSPQCEGYPVETEHEWGVLKVGCVNGGILRPEENKTLPPELEPIPSLGISTGDLLISRANTRELVGSAAVAHRDYPNLLLCDKLYRLRFKHEICAPSFIASYLGTDMSRGQIELAATGASSSMVNIAQSTILELEIALPELCEQQAIVAYVDGESAKFDILTTEARHAIDLLQERRTALISAAVTGQMDVRIPT